MRIWPYPERVKYFEQFGMPDRLADNYQEWLDANAAKAYGLFLVSHPGFVAVTLWENMDQFSSDFIHTRSKTQGHAHHRWTNAAP